MSIIKSTTKQNENKFRIHTITLFNSPPLNSKVTNMLQRCKSHKISSKHSTPEINLLLLQNKKVNYLQPNLLNRPLSNYSLKRFFNFATEKEE